MFFTKQLHFCLKKICTSLPITIPSPLHNNFWTTNALSNACSKGSFWHNWGVFTPWLMGKKVTLNVPVTAFTSFWRTTTSMEDQTNFELKIFYWFFNSKCQSNMYMDGRIKWSPQLNLTSTFGKLKLKTLQLPLRSLLHNKVRCIARLTCSWRAKQRNQLT